MAVSTSWAICKSAPCSRQITTPAPHHSVFTGLMPFLPPSQQRQSTEGKSKFLKRTAVRLLIMMVVIHSSACGTLTLQLDDVPNPALQQTVLGAKYVVSTRCSSEQIAQMDGISFANYYDNYGGSVAEQLACWTQAQKGPGSNRSRDAVG